MKSANPYLNFNGNTEEAFNFYKSIFGGDFLALQRFKDIPNSENTPDDAKEKLMHIALKLWSNVILMGTDALESMGQYFKLGNNIHISLQTDSKDEADRLFYKLAESGVIEYQI